LQTVICVSGGIDSVIAWFYERKPTAVYFDLGTKYTQKEIACLHSIKAIVPDFNFIVDDSLKSFGILESGRTAFIPYRNLLFATVCAAKYGEDVVIGGIKGDNVCDKNPAAFGMMEKCLCMVGDKPVTIRSPFWNMTKPDIMAWFLEHVSNAQEIMKTSVSCYSSGEMACGLCPSCIRKWFALKYLGVDCEGWFENNPRTSPEILGYILRMRAGNYDLERTKEMFMVLKKEDLIDALSRGDLENKIKIREMDEKITKILQCPDSEADKELYRKLSGKHWV
jgi:7-cyano-7-deazaguanine synthase in queuosine biosynthesis